MPGKNTRVPLAIFKNFVAKTKQPDAIVNSENLIKLDATAKYLRWGVGPGYKASAFNLAHVGYAIDVYVGMDRLLKTPKAVNGTDRDMATDVQQRMGGFLQNGVLRYPDPAMRFWPLDTLWSRRKTHLYTDTELASTASCLVTPDENNLHSPWLNRLTDQQHATLRFLSNFDTAKKSPLKAFVLKAALR